MERILHHQPYPHQKLLHHWRHNAILLAQPSQLVRAHCFYNPPSPPASPMHQTLLAVRVAQLNSGFFKVLPFCALSGDFSRLVVANFVFNAVTSIRLLSGCRRMFPGIGSIPTAHLSLKEVHIANEPGTVQKVVDHNRLEH